MKFGWMENAMKRPRAMGEGMFHMAQKNAGMTPGRFQPSKEGAGSMTPKVSIRISGKPRLK